MSEELPELEATPRTALYGQQFLDSALEKFGREGLWLLLSLHQYGWRAHRDMAALLLSDYGPSGLGADARAHHSDHRAMAALEEVFLLLDQIWRMIGAIEAHRGGEGFLSGYRRYGRDIAAEFSRLEALGGDEWQEIFSLPRPDDLARIFGHMGFDPPDPAHFEAMVSDLVGTTVQNMREVGTLFARVNDAVGTKARSIRDINNAYRHGTQVVYANCAPDEIPWRAANPEEADGLLLGIAEVGASDRAETVNILLEEPDDAGHARFASMPRDRVWADAFVRSMEHLSVLLYKLVVTLLVSEVSGGPVIGALLLEWDDLNK